MLSCTTDEGNFEDNRPFISSKSQSESFALLQVWCFKLCFVSHETLEDKIWWLATDVPNSPEVSSTKHLCYTELLFEVINYIHVDSNFSIITLIAIF